MKYRKVCPKRPAGLRRATEGSGGNKSPMKETEMGLEDARGSRRTAEDYNRQLITDERTTKHNKENHEDR